MIVIIWSWLSFPCKQRELLYTHGPRFLPSLLIDWLKFCLMFSEQYFSFIKDNNKFNHNIKTIRNEGRDGSTWSKTVDCNWKKYGELGRDEKENSFLFTGYNTPTLFSKSTKDVFSVQRAWHSASTLNTTRSKSWSCSWIFLFVKQDQQIFVLKSL